jgi:hypothetical protein
MLSPENSKKVRKKSDFCHDSKLQASYSSHAIKLIGPLPSPLGCWRAIRFVSRCESAIVAAWNYAYRGITFRHTPIKKASRRLGEKDVLRKDRLSRSVSPLPDPTAKSG